MHNAIILVYKMVQVFNQPSCTEFYCLATAIIITRSTFIRRGLEWQSKQENYYSSSGRYFWRAWDAKGCPNAFLTNPPLRKHRVQLGQRNTAMSHLIQQLIIRDRLFCSLGEECWKKGMQEVMGDGTSSQSKQQYQPWMLETLSTSDTSFHWDLQLHTLIPEGKSRLRWRSPSSSLFLPYILYTQPTPS